MGDPRDAKKREWGSGDFEPEEQPSRSTIKPAFNVTQYAQSEFRERMSTIVDDEATEEARIASVLMDSNPPTGADKEKESEVRIAIDYAELEALGPEQQKAFLRARLAPLRRVPVLVRKISELGGLIEDPKTAYILGFVDGLLPLETIVEVAGLPEIDTLRILDRAIDHNVITFAQEAR